MIWKSRSEATRLKVFVAGLTDTGRIRKNNEDSFLVERLKNNYVLCVVADGMGGQEYGEVASRIVVQTFHEESSKLPGDNNILQWLNNTVDKAQGEVLRQLDQLNPENGMGSTLVAGVFADDGCYLANVGDSRAYLLRGNHMQRLTKDHSLMEIMLDKGLIQPDEAYTHPRRGEITRFIGQRNDMEVDIDKQSIQSGDILLFCSDGLWEMVRDKDMESLLKYKRDPVKAAQNLIKQANQSGGVDNITAVVVQVA